MPPSSERLTVIVPTEDPEFTDFACEVREGLTNLPKRLPCRFLYDSQGSELFERICELPEYYVTRTEKEILEEHAEELASLFPEDTTMVELGSGSSAKTRVLIEAFLRSNGRLQYVPMDISRTILVESSEALLKSYRGLEIIAIAAEYNAGLRQLGAHAPERKLVLWLGSTLGNFERAEAARFVEKIRRTLNPRDRLLVGIDLRKEKDVLEKAYDDSQGVTAKFNLNLLARINRELDGHFRLARFRHHARYDETAGRVESSLVSVCEQRVRIDELDREVEFAKGERIHTENSYKYSLEEIDTLAYRAGLRTEHRWFDDGERFSLNLFAPL